MELVLRLAAFFDITSFRVLNNRAAGRCTFIDVAIPPKAGDIDTASGMLDPETRRRQVSPSLVFESVDFAAPIDGRRPRYGQVNASVEKASLQGGAQRPALSGSVVLWRTVPGEDDSYIYSIAL